VSPPERDERRGGSMVRPALDGILLVDKPSGMSSAQVVSKVRRALGVRRVGHTGTLDPMATGVLPLCIGEATKVAGYLLAQDKAYEAACLLGVETDTLDADGVVTARAPVNVSRGEVLEAMAHFVGLHKQVPPMHSAIKQGGVPLYKLARKGVAVERKPRLVEIRRFELTAAPLPRLEFVVECSKGTYVRSLVADLGTRLGCGAHLTALRRVRSGSFAIDAAVNLDAVSANEPPLLISPAAALAYLPGYPVGGPGLAAVQNGKPVAWQQLFGPRELPSAEVFRLLTPQGGLAALARLDGQTIRYLRVFRQSLTGSAISSKLSHQRIS
jgi:tRNA pseudouridine55 synthase